MDTPEAEATESRRNLETLLVACESAEPYSLRVLDFASGTSLWSFKGIGDGDSISHAEFVGTLGCDLLAIAQSAKPIVHLIDQPKSSKPSSTHSTVAGIVRGLASHPSGELLHCCIDDRIYTWMIKTGELLSIVGESSVGDISVMKVSKCGAYLVTGCANGSVLFYLTGELMRNDALCRHSYSPHTSTVEDLHITTGVQNPRVLSVSADHSAVFYSISAKQTLLRTSSELPLTACCMDSAECMMFLGAESGKICALDFFSTEERVSGKDGGSEGTKKAVAFYNQHSARINRMVVNNDGTRLASGDCQGVYCVWDIGSRQCLKMASMKGRITGRIVQLAFILNWASSNTAENMRTKRKMPTLDTTLSDPQSTVFTKSRIRRARTAMEIESVLDEHLDSEIARLNPSLTMTTERRVNEPETNREENPTTPLMYVGGARDAPPLDTTTTDQNAVRIRELEQEISQLRKANRELFAYALQLAKEKH